ncbi:hypothetical protein Lepto7375DRAFT_7185 [Leptolyngbya sp. PCC 7375]|nr:hypothetical protein Lepto7375DRAFT_7185 [Leptolyngbya sp. PCC 7375]
MGCSYNMELMLMSGSIGVTTNFAHRNHRKPIRVGAYENRVYVLEKLAFKIGIIDYGFIKVSYSYCR